MRVRRRKRPTTVVYLQSIAMLRIVNASIGVACRSPLRCAAAGGWKSSLSAAAAKRYK